MTTPSEFQTAVAKSVTNMDRLNRFVNGAADETVETDNGSVPTLAKKLDEWDQLIEDALAESSVSSIPGLQAALDGKAPNTFTQSGTGAVARTVQGKLRETVSVTDFGAIPDNSTNNSAAIAAALATGKAVRFPVTDAGNTYRFSTSITTVSGAEIICDDEVVLFYTGSTGAAVNLTGTGVKVVLGEVLAPAAPYAIRYYNLEFSNITVRRPGQCTSACIYHDGDLQVANAGNNRWVVEDVQAGSVPYGVRIKNSTVYILEGEIWDIKVIFSATTCAFRLGESPNNRLCRWNNYRLAVDAQGITPLLIDVYQDSNKIELINWAGLASPPVGHVRFNTGTGSNLLMAGPGVQNSLTVVDNGINLWSAPGIAGQQIFGGQMLVNIEAGGTAPTFLVGDDSPTGDVIAGVENKSSANNTTKYASFGFRGRDTIGTSKSVAELRAQPQDADWVNATAVIYGRNGDALAPYAFFGINGTPEGQITAPVGAIATRRDGGASTTLYVKQSGTGSSGWVAK